VDISRNVAASAYDPGAVAGAVTTETIRAAVRELGLAGLPLEVHAALSSFGRVEGGAATVVDALLAEGCTVVVPTFTRSPSYLIDPPETMRPERKASTTTRCRRGARAARTASSRPRPTT